MGVICRCLITLRPILRFVFGKAYDLSGGQRSTTGTDTRYTHASSNGFARPFRRMENSMDTNEAPSTYHTIIGGERRRQDSDSPPLDGIYVVTDFEVERFEMSEL